jgi:hypothetical protein
MNPATGRRAIPVYLLVTWTVSSLFYCLIIKSAGTNAADGAYTRGLMWCPAIGALVTGQVSFCNRRSSAAVHLLGNVDSRAVGAVTQRCHRERNPGNKRCVTAVESC